jgi:tRNA-binding protein
VIKLPKKKYTPKQDVQLGKEAASEVRKQYPIDMSEFSPAPVKATIPLDIFKAIDVRLGTIRAVEELPKSRKLLKLTVSFGDHTRQILAGIKTERPDPHQLIGRQALFVVNLEHRVMAGETSEGMLFDIGYEDGLTPSLAIPEHALPDGARAG